MIAGPVFVAQSSEGGRIEQVTADTHRQAIDMAKSSCKQAGLSAQVTHDSIPGGFIEYKCYKEKSLAEWLAPVIESMRNEGS